MNKENLPQESFSDKDAELLVKHYGQKVPEDKVQKILQEARKMKDAYRIAQQSKQVSHQQSKQQGR